MLTETQFSVGTVKLHGDVGPQHGPPLLMLHGVLRRGSDFAPLLPFLLPRWQVNRLDFRGHGLSDHVAQSYRVVDYCEDVPGVLEQLSDEPAILYGHSLGAMVAARVASQVPTQVRALILEDPPFHTMGSLLAQSSLQSLFEGMQRSLAGGGDVHELTRRLREIEVRQPGASESKRLSELRDGASLRYSASCLQRIDPEVLAPIVSGSWLDGYDFTALTEIRCPTLLLQADPAAGGMLRDEDAGLLRESLRECHLIRFDGTGHLLHWDATASLVRAVLNFLESLD